MNHRVVEVRHYNFTAEDKLFLDANIWLYLHAPYEPRAYQVVDIYSKTFSRILEAKSQIYS